MGYGRDAVLQILRLRLEHLESGLAGSLDGFVGRDLGGDVLRGFLVDSSGGLDTTGVGRQKSGPRGGVL